MPDSGKPDDPVPDVMNLIDGLHPFLDAGCQVYCYLPHEEPEKRLVLRLDDHRVRSLLLYLFMEKHGRWPAWDSVYRAMALVQGRMLKTRKGRPLVTDDPTLRLFLHATRHQEGWAGSAKEVLDLLKETQKTTRLLKSGTDQLPENPTAMGIWLRKNQLRLLAYGIELYQPTRRSTQRLWAWRSIIEDCDTSDASGEHLSPLASLWKGREDSGPQPAAGSNDARDTYGDDDLKNDLKEALT